MSVHGDKLSVKTRCSAIRTLVFPTTSRATSIWGRRGGLERLSAEGRSTSCSTGPATREDGLGRLLHRTTCRHAMPCLLVGGGGRAAVVVTMGSRYSRPIEHSVAAHVDVFARLQAWAVMRRVR